MFKLGLIKIDRSLRGTNLEGTNFRGAVYRKRSPQAKNSQTTYSWNRDTAFPPNFNPVDAGMSRESDYQQKTQNSN